MKLYCEADHSFSRDQKEDVDKQVNSQENQGILITLTHYMLPKTSLPSLR